RRARVAQRSRSTPSCARSAPRSSARSRSDARARARRRCRPASFGAAFRARRCRRRCWSTAREFGRRVASRYFTCVKRLLIVEDKESLALMLREAVESEGLEADLASNGSDAMRRLAEGRRYFAVVTDLRLPGADGIAV